jgi:hypothetical protein
MQGVVVVWPIRLAGPDGRIDPWNRSALEHASRAKEKWIRVQSNSTLGAYEIVISDSVKPATWPDLSFEELLTIAFKGKYIDNVNHPVLRRLRGEF